MKYIALLRAVNVGGKNKLKMADLRVALESIGLDQVQTYIQSGNILFESDETEASLKPRIERAIEERFGLALDVVLRTLPELDDMVEHCPFAQHQESESESSSPATMHVALLDAPPQGEDISRLDRFVSDSEQYQVVGRDVFLLLKQGMGNSKMAPQVHKLGTSATLRNWKTLNRLRVIAHDTE